MANLYPPYIGNILPAATSVTIPYTVNKAVNKNSIKKITVKIKTIDNKNIKYVSTTTIPSTNTVIFSLPSGLNKNDYYKVQLAFFDNINDSAENGIYSTVGVIKILDATPNITLSTTSFPISATFDDNGTGEKVYKYKFVGTNNNMSFDTGWKVHDSSLNIDYLGVMDFDAYSLTYYYETISGYSNSIAKEVPKKTGSNLGTLSIVYDKENACNIISGLIPSGDWMGIIKKTGQFWSIVGPLSEAGSIIDFDIKYGQNYEYKILKKSSGNTINFSSTSFYSNESKCYFEDSFLFDKDKQLCIKYNPKISNYKINNAESKIDTIGNKYPFIFRNSAIGYKDFSISGLISYLSDKEGYFIKNFYEKDGSYRQNTNSQKVANEYMQTDLSDENVEKELEFKNDVLSWLSNGKPKILKTPVEGNFIVYLQNISLSPNDTLGRMLHNFQCQAYEIADYNSQSMARLGLIDAPEGIDLFVDWKSTESTDTSKGNITPDTVVAGYIGYAKGQEIVGGLGSANFNIDPIEIKEKEEGVYSIGSTIRSNGAGYVTAGWSKEISNNITNINKGGRYYPGNYSGEDLKIIDKNTYVIDDVYIISDVDFLGENIRYGTTLWSMPGTFTQEKADVAATSNDLRAGKIAYVNGQRINGGLETKIDMSNLDYSTLPVIKLNGLFDMELDVSANQFLGTGSFIQPSINPATGVVSYGYNVTKPGYFKKELKNNTFILPNLKGGNEIQPKATDQTAINQGYFATGDIVVKGDSNLKAENILKGQSIFGVNGSVIAVNNQSKTTDCPIDGSTIVFDNEYTGLDSVTINPLPRHNPLNENNLTVQKSKGTNNAVVTVTINNEAGYYEAGSFSKIIEISLEDFPLIEDSLEINSNGITNVANYKKVNVQVPQTGFTVIQINDEEAGTCEIQIGDGKL